MTKDEIAKAAKEAEIGYVFCDELVRFVAIVEAAEREECARIAESLEFGRTAAAVIRERGTVTVTNPDYGAYLKKHHLGG